MSQKKQNLTVYILVAMVVGAVVGQLIHAYFPETIQIKDASGELKSIVRSEYIGQYFKILTSVFLRLVQMIIAPLVITTLIVGIAKMGNLKAVGRVGGRSMIWFFSASLASLLLGLMLVNFFAPGAALKLNVSGFDTSAASDVIGKTQSFSLQHFIEHL
ncbi:MAG: cation:dicarboxylate symporter family transporter, partial [Bacteroidia bacterium]